MATGAATDQLCINTIRTLAIDAAQSANSGHAGTPMAMARVVYTLWQQFLRYDPADPTWPNRDRFVLSAVHASMLLYAMLHLAGVQSGPDSNRPSLRLDDLKRFRQLDSRTPGHPEFGFTPGVETTTGPIGQGCGNSVGMAMAGRWLGERYNRPGLTLFDYDVYVLCSDGDLMAGVASVAASLAGHLKLANLCWIYDNNTVTIEGQTPLAFSEDVGRRFEGYRWNVLRVGDANDTEAVAQALAAFRGTSDRPTLIVVDSIIGYGAPNEQEHGGRAQRPARRGGGAPRQALGIATRDASGKVLNAIAARVPWLVGGSADLAPSTKTKLAFEGAGDLEPEQPGGRNLHFGVREHAMGSIVNGLALSGLRPFGATFLIFSDYMRPPIRLAALMELPVFHVLTHDSIGVGEDGPTHQPIEQLVGLRAIPGLIVLRPADANEVAEAHRVVMRSKHQPVCLILSRQALPVFDRARYAPASGLARGAYVMADAPNGRPEVVLIGTGSEVRLCIAAYERLTMEGIATRVVSMPSWELFGQQEKAFQDRVLPPAVTARVAVEQGSVIGWDRYVGRTGAVIGMHSFGSSAPLKDLLTKFGFTSEKVYEAAKHQIARSRV